MPAALLLVDMHREFAQLLCDYFQIGGKHKIRLVGVAGNGAQAVEMAARLKPDVVVIDCFTLQRELFITVRELRNLPGQAGPAVLMIETYCDETCEKELKAAGASGFLCKPFDMERLAEKIESLCAGTAMKRN